MAQADFILDSGMQEVAALITEGLRAELIKQGHRATGRLISSIQAEVINLVTGAEVDVSYLDYGRTVNTGQKPGHWVPLADLVKWVKVKGIENDPLKVQGAARAIQRAIHRYGTPTPGREANFPGDTGRLTGFQDYTVDEKTGKITSDMMETVKTYVSQVLTNILAELNPVEIKL